MKQSDFINEANKVHNNIYDYSLVKYKNNKTKVEIICKKHGVFEQRPYNHLKGHKCPSCTKNKKLTNDEFINKANIIHNFRFDYSLTKYKNMGSKIKIICKEHGVFELIAGSHLKGSICKKCNDKIDSTEKFNKAATEIHGDRYDYSLVEYTKSSGKVKIICKLHNIIFEQIANNHTSKKHNCPECSRLKRRLNRIKQIEIEKFNGNRIIPSYNSKACDIFNEIMKENNCFIQHAMNGGEFYIKDLGYWLDGYDKENNTVYEFDEKHHFDKNGNIRHKDLMRQIEIETFLKCKFIRIKDES